jgi:hypothetical protein
MSIFVNQEETFSVTIWHNKNDGKNFRCIGKSNRDLLIKNKEKDPVDEAWSEENIVFRYITITPEEITKNEINNFLLNC